MRIYYLITSLSFYALFGYSQTECLSKDGEIPMISAEKFYLEGKNQFPVKIKLAIDNVEGYFNYDMTYYLAKDYDGICHKYDGFRKGTITIGQIFIEKNINNQFLFEFILAHEFAHNLQHNYKSQFRDRFKRKYGMDVMPGLFFELQADIIAGYYWSHTDTKHNTSEMELIKFLNEISDMSFSNPNSHGSLDMRLRALEFGYKAKSSKITVFDDVIKIPYYMSKSELYELSFEISYKMYKYY